MTSKFDVRDPRFKDFRFLESVIISLSANAQTRSVDLVIDHADSAFAYYQANGPSLPTDSPCRMFIHVGMQDVASLALTRGKVTKSFSDFLAKQGATCLYDLVFTEFDGGLEVTLSLTEDWEIVATCASAWYETRVCSCTGDKESGWTYRDIETRKVVDFYRPFAIDEGTGWE
jgi:hypothetical protein